jgi:hypothetical protein
MTLEAPRPPLLRFPHVVPAATAVDAAPVSDETWDPDPEEWECLPYIPGHERLDPGGCPNTTFHRSAAAKIARLYRERQKSRWKKDFAQFLLAEGLSRAKRRSGGAIVYTMYRRGDRLEAIVLVLLAMFYRVDLVTRDVFLDGSISGPMQRRNSNRGLSIARLGLWTKLSRWRVNRALSDLKDAGIEYFHDSDNGHRRFPNRQPRRQVDPETKKLRLPDDPLIPGVKIYSEPAVRCLDTHLVARIFGFELGLRRASQDSARERGLDLRLHRGKPKKHVRKKRRRDEAQKPRVRPTASEPVALASILPALLGRFGDPTDDAPPARFDRNAIADSQAYEILTAEMFAVRIEIRDRLGYRVTHGPPPPELEDDVAIEAEARRRIEKRGGTPF